MRKTILLISFLILNVTVSAQDIVVLKSGDTLVGKINLRSDVYLTIELKNYAEVRRIKWSAIKKYTRAYYDDTTKKVVASDRFIFQTGDSMKVRIISKDENFYFYTSSKDNFEKEKRIAKTTVLELKRNVSFDTIVVVTPSVANKEKLKALITPPKQPKRFVRVGLDGGIFLRGGTTPSNLSQTNTDYVNAMKLSLGLNLSIAYYFIPHLGIGFDYLYSNSSSSGVLADILDNPYKDDPHNVENINISHYCPYISLLANLNSKKSVKYTLNLGVGYQTLKDEVNYGTLEVTGNTIGFMVSNQIDFLINPNLAFGFRADYSYGTLSSETINSRYFNSVTVNRDIQLEQLSFSTGFKFYIF